MGHTLTFPLPVQPLFCAPKRADTRPWTALQNASGGPLGGCIYDVDEIVKRPRQEPARGRFRGLPATHPTTTVAL